MKRKIMIVDDHTIVLHGLTLLINSEPDFEVTLQAGSTEAALAILKADNAPDLVITDISLPGLSGIELLKELGMPFKNIKKTDN